jgi:hypothetical protein
MRGGRWFEALLFAVVEGEGRALCVVDGGGDDMGFGFEGGEHFSGGLRVKIVTELACQLMQRHGLTADRLALISPHRAQNTPLQTGSRVCSEKTAGRCR